MKEILKNLESDDKAVIGCGCCIAAVLIAGAVCDCVITLARLYLEAMP